MEIFRALSEYDYEQIVFCHDANAGLRAVIAIHDTTLGPALGGVRMWPYTSETDAVQDVLRLARGMTYKAAAAGLNLGGGKAVIIGDPQKDKNEMMFRAFGRYVQGLNGRYISAEDVGTTVEDMDTIFSETDFVTGLSPAFGSGGNPSPVTAFGVYRGIKAGARAVFGSDDLSGKTFAIQGLGNVAFRLCQYLHEEGADLVVTDLNEQNVARAVQKFNAKSVDVDEIYDVDCDVFSPNALGGIVNDETIPRFKCRMIAGAANNQLAEGRHGDQLRANGITYVPDFVLNAGGLINVADELMGYNRERALKKVETLYDTVLKVLAIAEKEKITSHAAADRLAEARIETVQRSRRSFLHNEKNILNVAKTKR